MQENTRGVTPIYELGDAAFAIRAAVSAPACHACRVGWAGSHLSFRTQLQAPTRCWAAFWVAEAAGPPLPKLRLRLLQQLRKSRQASFSLGHTGCASVRLYCVSPYATPRLGDSLRGLLSFHVMYHPLVPLPALCLFKAASCGWLDCIEWHLLQATACRFEANCCRYTRCLRCQAAIKCVAHGPV